MKILGDQIRSNPDQVLNNVSLITERMQNEHSAFPFVRYYSLITPDTTYYNVLIFSASNNFQKHCRRRLQENRKMSFQNHRPNHQFSILVYTFAKKQQVHGGI